MGRVRSIKYLKLDGVNIFKNYVCNGWRNINKKKFNHEDRNYHEDAIQEADGILNHFLKALKTIGYHSCTTLNERCSKYLKKIKIICLAIYFYEMRAFLKWDIRLFCRIKGTLREYLNGKRNVSKSHQPKENDWSYW